MFKNIDNKVISSLNNLSENYFEWYNNIKNKKTSADPHVISFADAYNLTLITQEEYNKNNNGNNKTSEKKYKIPVICDLLNANIFIRTYQKTNSNAPFDCICFSEFIKREKLFDF